MIKLEGGGGDVEGGNDDIYTLCKSLCDLASSASKCAPGTAQKLVECEYNYPSSKNDYKTQKTGELNVNEERDSTVQLSIDYTFSAIQHL